MLGPIILNLAFANCPYWQDVAVAVQFGQYTAGRGEVDGIVKHARTIANAAKNKKAHETGMFCNAYGKAPGVSIKPGDAEGWLLSGHDAGGYTATLVFIAFLRLSPV